MKSFICTICPRSCLLEVDEELNVTGNFCPRGIPYGKSEATNPLRSLTTTVACACKNCPRLPVKTSGDIPKDKMFDVINELKSVVVTPPVKIDRIIVKNILNLGVDIVATKSIGEKDESTCIF